MSSLINILLYTLNNMRIQFIAQTEQTQNQNKIWSYEFSSKCLC